MSRRRQLAFQTSRASHEDHLQRIPLHGARLLEAGGQSLLLRILLNPASGNAGKAATQNAVNGAT